MFTAVRKRWSVFALIRGGSNGSSVQAVHIMKDTFITRRKFCAQLQVCAATARLWEIKRKLTPYVVAGGPVRYRVSEVEQLLEEAKRSTRKKSGPKPRTT